MDIIFWNQTFEHWGSLSRYIGPYKISHWLRKFGYETQVIDFVSKMTEDQLYSVTKNFITKSTLVLGISTTFIMSTPNSVKGSSSTSKVSNSVINVLRKIKEEYPNLKVVVGGHGSNYIDFDGLIDATVMSYTESTEDVFLEYVNHLRKGSPPPLIQITSNRGNSILRKHYYKAREKKYNIEVDDFRFIEQDVILDKEPLPLDISRGCIFSCKFCKYPHLGKGKLDYVRDMSRIKEEVLHNFERFGTTNYMILDDTFNDTEIKLRNFLQMTEELPFKISYTSYLRADLIDRFPDMAYMLEESGLWGAYHGIESLHPYASRVVGKGWSGKSAREYIPKLYWDIWKGKIPQSLAFIIGLPGENIESINDTVKWFSDNNLWSISYSKLYISDISRKDTSYPSEFEKNAKEYGFTFGDNDFWQNDTWTSDTAGEEFQRISNFIKENKLSKNTVWNLGTLEMLGFSREYLFNTSIKDMDWKKVTDGINYSMQDYIDRLFQI